MIEELTPSPGPKREQLKEEEMTSEQKAEAWLALQGSPLWGEGVTGDFMNVMAFIPYQCEVEPLWERIKPLKTIQEYIEAKFAGTEAPDAAEIAAAAIRKTNQEFLEKANVIIADMNSIIGDGVTSGEQTDALMSKYRTFVDLLQERKG